MSNQMLMTECFRNPPVFTCELCGLEGLNSDDMKLHQRAVHANNEVSCFFCELSGVTPEEMTIHINAVHCHENSDNAVMHSSQDDKSVVDTGLTMGISIQNGDHSFLNSRLNLGESSQGQTLSVAENSMFAKRKQEVSASAVDVRLNRVESSNGGRKRSCPEYANGHEGSLVADRAEILMNRTSATHLQTEQIATDELSRHSNMRSSKANNVPVSSRDVANHDQLDQDLLKCPLCDALASSEADMDLHFALLHGDDVHGMSDLMCPFCGSTFSDESFLQLHVDSHYAANETGSKSRFYSHEAQLRERQQSRPLSSEMSQNSIDRRSSSANGSGRPAHIDGSLIDDMAMSTKGIIEKLRALPVGGQVRERLVCSETTHFVSNGNNCGFRNLQMLLSCLANNADYLQVVFNGHKLMPSVYKLQELIENAWVAGYDHAGCKQLNGQLVGTQKWIGATEIVTLLSFLGVRCDLVDFHHPSGPQNTHPRLVEWVCNYFRRGQGRFLPPLYFQHLGHSRTIVGIEERTDGSVVLLIFDPGNRQMGQLSRQPDVTKLLNSLRRGANTIRKEQYQIVAVVGLLGQRDREARKQITSTRIP